VEINFCFSSLPPWKSIRPSWRLTGVFLTQKEKDKLNRLMLELND